MRASRALAVVAVVAVDLTATASGFVPPRQASVARLGTLGQAAPGDDAAGQTRAAEKFMEEASAKGADKIQAMALEERTRRAMLAEALEDRIFSMYDDIEGLLKDGVPATEEDRDEIKSLAEEIKASQAQYEILVSGAPSIMLGTINDIGSFDRSDFKRAIEEDVSDP